MKITNEALELIRKKFSLTRITLAEIQGKRREFIASAGEEDFVPKKQIQIDDKTAALYSAENEIDENELKKAIKSA